MRNGLATGVALAAALTFVQVVAFPVGLGIGTDGLGPAGEAGPAVAQPREIRPEETELVPAEPHETGPPEHRGPDSPTAPRAEPRPSIVPARDTDAPAVESALRDDPALAVDADGAMSYVEPLPTGPEPETSAGAAAAPSSTDPAMAAAADPGDVFRLHSARNTRRTIYLDFDGELIANSAWNAYTRGDCRAEPFDRDGDPTRFSDDERSAIREVWARVSEDFAPFAVDVTTEAPDPTAISRDGSADLVYGTRVLLTNGQTVCPNGATFAASVCPNGCSGRAYIGVFNKTTDHTRSHAAVVLTHGSIGRYAKWMAEVATHETGHMLGLTHDGTGQAPYAPGHADWSPIMGVAFSRPVTQWSRGEYADANNAQDDLAQLVAGGVPLRADDHGDTAERATTLAVGTAAPGRITTRADVDAFRFTTTGGRRTITATPAGAGANLDIRMELRAADGTVVAIVDPPSTALAFDRASGMGATIAVSLAPGTYTVVIDGTGFGDPATTGYSDYGSVGTYRLAVR